MSKGYKGFHHTIAKYVFDMSLDELKEEIISCVSWRNECEATGQGVNSKETIRERNCRAEVLRRVVAGEITVDEGCYAIA